MDPVISPSSLIYTISSVCWCFWSMRNTSVHCSFMMHLRHRRILSSASRFFISAHRPRVIGFCNMLLEKGHKGAKIKFNVYEHCTRMSCDFNSKMPLSYIIVSGIKIMQENYSKEIHYLSHSTYYSFGCSSTCEIACAFSPSGNPPL